MMKWNHLPVAGGIYNQHPKFLDDMVVIHQIDIKAQKRQQAQQQAKMRRKK